MNHLNSVLFEGIAVKDPERITLQRSDAVLVKFTVESSRSYLDSEGRMQTERTAVPVQCWGELGEKVLERIRKGSAVRAVGRLRYTRWISPSGSTVKSIEIVAEHVETRKVTAAEADE